MQNSRVTSWRRLAAVLAGVSALATLSTLLAGQAEARTVTGANPVLGYESAAFNADHSVTVHGWVLNPPKVRALAHAYVYVDNLDSPNNVLPTVVRSDVRRLYPAAPATTGFTFHSKRLGYGRHTVCVTAVTFGTTPSRRSPRLCRVLNYPNPNPNPAPTINQKLTGYAKTFINKYHYQEGGRTPATGFDCAGLTSYVYAHYSINVAPQVGKAYPTAQAQYNHFRAESRAAARPGDLVFFHRAGTVFHTGIYLGNNMMVAAADYGYPMRYQTIWSTAVTFGTVTHS